MSDLGPALAVQEDLRPDPAVAGEDISVAYAAGCMVSMSSTEVIGGRPGCVFGDPQGATTVALVGDSKMEQWSSALDAIGRAEGWRVLVYTRSACRFTTEEDAACAGYNRQVAATLDHPDHRPDLVVLSHGASGGSEVDEEAAGTVELLAPLVDRGTRVAVLADTARPRPASDPEQPSYECLDEHRDDYAPCRYTPGRGPDEVGTPALAAVADRLEAPLVSLDPWICPVSEQVDCPPVVGGVTLFRQGSHLTSTYVRTLTPLLHHELTRAGVARTPYEQIRWEPADAVQG